MRCEQVMKRLTEKAASLQICSTDAVTPPTALQGQCWLQVDPENNPPIVKVMGMWDQITAHSEIIMEINQDPAHCYR